MSETATHASPNAALGRRFLNGFMVAGVAAVFMAITGALNTDKISIGPRLAYWLIVMQMGSLIGVAVNAGIREWGRLSSNPRAEAVLVAILIAFPLTLVVTGSSMIFFGGPVPSWIEATVIFAIVAFVSLIMTGINYLLPTRAAAHAPAVITLPTALPEIADASPPEPTLPRFVNHLPIGLRSADILALSAEDHYLRVYTSAGEALILMRLSDAIGELAGTNGLQTHRSWWVAKAAVIAATRGDGKGALTLRNGVEAPISRTYLKDVSAAGWF